MSKIYVNKELCGCVMCDFKYGCPLKNTRFEEMKTKWGHIPLQQCGMAKAGVIIHDLEGLGAYIMILRESTTLENHLKYLINNKDMLDWEAIGKDCIKLFIMLYKNTPKLKEVLKGVPTEFEAYTEGFFDEWGRVKKDMIEKF